MRKLFLALALLLGSGAPAWAMNCPTAQSPTTVYQCTQIVFNDTGSALTSGSVVAWDDDDTDFSTTLYPYVTTTTTDDDPYTAGVVLDASCADQSLCNIVIYGPANVLLADGTSATAADTLISATTVAGQAGDYATGANTCALGTLIAKTGGGADGTVGRVFVRIDCD